MQFKIGMTPGRKQFIFILALFVEGNYGFGGAVCASNSRLLLASSGSEFAVPPQTHVVGAPRIAIDPAFSALRREALERELEALGITGIEADATLEGTSALKAFNSFITPRPENDMRKPKLSASCSKSSASSGISRSAAPSEPCELFTK